MLIRFRVENHRSIKDEQQISFVAAPLKDSPEKTTPVEKYGIDLLRVAGIYGANASGKSTVLDALQFMKKAVVDSHSVWKPDGGIPRKPFLLDPKSLSEPSLFEVDILLKGTRYTYGFVVDSTEVLEEWLYAYPEGRKQSWFVRDKSESTEFSFSRHLTGENKAIQGLTRPNSLFLSTAVQNNHQMLSAIFKWFSSSLEFIDQNNRSELPRNTAELFQNQTYQSLILTILKGSDVGITGINIQKEDPYDPGISDSDNIFEKVGKQGIIIRRMLDELVSPSFSNVLLIHCGTDGSNVPIAFLDESQGTKSLFGLAGKIVETLAYGKLICIDELDSSLHPDMAMEIVRWFNDPKRNPNNAQLMFNTHDTNIMENELRRDQIWFTQKDREGATHLYSLSDFKARKEENIKLGYLQGRYGAVPFININMPELNSSGMVNEKR